VLVPLTATDCMRSAMPRFYVDCQRDGGGPSLRARRPSRVRGQDVPTGVHPRRWDGGAVFGGPAAGARDPELEPGPGVGEDLVPLRRS